MISNHFRQTRGAGRSRIASLAATEKGADISAPSYLLTDCAISQDDVCLLARQEGSFVVSHLPENERGWLEILVDGLTFDLSGLSSDLSNQQAPEHLFDVELAIADQVSRISLSPGPHISAASAIPGVVAAHLRLLLRLTQLTGVLAVGWTPANSLMSPSYFKRVVSNWLDGGPFPALGIASLKKINDDTLQSEGLAYFTGQEILVEVVDGNDQAAAKLAVRVIDYLVDRGSLEREQTIEAPNGGYLLLSPDREKKLIRVLK